MKTRFRAFILVGAIFLLGCGTASTLFSCAQTDVLSVLVVYRAGANGSINNKPRVLQSVMAGGNTQEVNAIPAPGYRFLRWDDGLEKATRIDYEIYESFERIAYFVKEGSAL